jgi:nitrate reductase assembly molybdenum cofactor insertion protein NarJ
MRQLRTTMDARALALLKQAAEWRLIGLLFECPAGAWRDDIVALARDSDDPLLGSAVAHALEEASEGLYHSTFGPGGPAPPREVTYVKAVQLGYLLSELTAFYDAFAYQPVTQESPDHVSVEAGFIGYLRLKEAYAVARGDDQQAAVTAEAAATFVREHLSALAEPLAATLEASGVAYLAEAARALGNRVGPPPSAVASPPAGRLLPVIQPLEDDDEIACAGTGGTDL